MAIPPDPPTDQPSDAEPTRPIERAGSGPDAALGQATASSRRAMVAVLAALFLFGSCGIAYGVYRATRGGDARTVFPSPSLGPGSPSPSVAPSPSPTESPGIDLIVTGLSGSETTVQNVGVLASGRFVVSVSGTAFIVPEGLSGGESVRFSFVCREGPLTVVADSTDRVEETDETNNARTAGPFDCASPTVSPTSSPTASPTATVPLPDLVVRTVARDRVVVANEGNASAGTFTVSAGKAGTFTVGGLAAGASRTVGFACTAGTLDVTVDPADRIQESNEGNNTRRGGPFECLPDLIVQDLSLDSVTIANVGVGPASSSVVGINGQTFNVPALAAGASVTITYPCVGGTVTALADFFADIAESKETNNQVTAELGPCPVP